MNVALFSRSGASWDRGGTRLCNLRIVLTLCGLKLGLTVFKSDFQDFSRIWNLVRFFIMYFLRSKVCNLCLGL